MSTSKLQKQVSKELFSRFEKFGLRENIRPEWLYSDTGERLELDFFLEELDVAVEVQGNQHYEYSPFFHQNEYGFVQQQKRDTRKKQICDKMGIRLLEISSESDIKYLIEEIEQYIPDEKLDKSQISLSDRDIRILIRRFRSTTIRMQQGMSGDYTLQEQQRFLSKGRDIALFCGIENLKYLPDKGKQYFYLMAKLEERVNALKPVKVPKPPGEVFNPPKTYEWLVRDDVSEGCRQKKIRRARKNLMIEIVNLFTYRVWGGEKEHIVSITHEGVTCDCDAYKQGRQCSHVVKYMLYTEGT